MKRRTVIIVVVATFLMWNCVTYYFLVNKPQGRSAVGAGSQLESRLQDLQNEIQLELSQNSELLRRLHQYKRKIVSHQIDGGEKNIAPGEGNIGNGPDSPVVLPVDFEASKDSLFNVPIPVLVFACNRITVNRNLDQLIKYRPSAQRFPIIVTQDCGHAETEKVILSYGDKVTLIKHPDLSDIPLSFKEKKFQGYYKIARHYKWAISQVFHKFNYNAVIIVEDDLDISPDFFEYFSATYPLLHSDPSLWCVSAWNDNGKSGMVSNEPELLYRTDFFPGLGWMLEKSTWLELEPKWPKTFWDDWMRHPDQRKDRSCIRPEISRTTTFGKIGVSKGQFFEKHLKFIQLNQQFVPFTTMDISYLLKEKYDEIFVKKVYESPLLTVQQIRNNEESKYTTVRVQYSDKVGFKALAKQLGIMEDLKSGVPRAGYRGIVSFMSNGRRVFFAPPPTWDKYDVTWN
ncbi:unnamed protein product [Owenia fusiformis]|uniref:Alpha-1,3-mannosyl-glycoprotein 2-beta-N-acetylglucosaminyltransferase n=1 Tax=Owenia fusiformis TaxID=6347 RepID=A0A8S4P4G3_OWEFU|nr:unnamed protein product [Owenia fusiformis]